MSAINTIYQIINNDAISPIKAFYNYLHWQKIRITGKFPYEMNLEGIRFIVDQPTGVAALVKVFGLYDFNNMNLIRLILKSIPGTTFIDVGANIGTYTLIASDLAGKVISFEPHPKTYDNLVKNINVNKFLNVILYNLAVSECEGFVNFSDFSEGALNRVDETGSLVVECVTLDKIFKKHDLDKCLLKVDVEGYEFPVFKGFTKNLKNVLAIFVEGEGNKRLIDLLRSYDFIGPMYFHNKKQGLFSYPQKRKEDEIFISLDLLPYLQKIGISMQFLFDPRDHLLHLPSN